MAAKESKRRSEPAIFAESSAFKGVLKFSRPLKIFGKFEGEIRGGESLEVGPNAKIHAHIEAAHVLVYGQVVGNVVASEKVQLKAGAKLIGNIRSPKLEIDDGVIFEGQCEMKTAEPKLAQAS